MSSASRQPDNRRSHSSGQRAIYFGRRSDAFEIAATQPPVPHAIYDADRRRRLIDIASPRLPFARSATIDAEYAAIA